MRKEITITQALLDGKVYGVPELSRNLTIQIPEGTEDGAIFKIEGEGMPRFEEESDSTLTVEFHEEEEKALVLELTDDNFDEAVKKHPLLVVDC